MRCPTRRVSEYWGQGLSGSSNQRISLDRLSEAEATAMLAEVIGAARTGVSRGSGEAGGVVRVSYRWRRGSQGRWLMVVAAADGLPGYGWASRHNLLVATARLRGLAVPGARHWRT